MSKSSLLFLCPYPIGGAPSQRFRYEQYFDILKANGYGIRCEPFLSPAHYQTLYRTGNVFQKLSVFLQAFIKRLLLTPAYLKSDFVFIHREATPLGPPIIEWLLRYFFRKKIIYDFDDAIWLTDKLGESRWEKMLKYRSKVKMICRWSYKVSCGNAYLAEYAKQFSLSVIVNPTTIDTQNLHNPGLHRPQTHHKITVGWTGSSSTLKYLEGLEPVLQEVEKRFPETSFVVIADREPALRLANLHFIDWREETEIEDLLKIDIGIMPIPDDEWAKGKCGFKALQYLALAKAAVVSPVGVNTTIIEHGVNGFLASTQREWISALSTLVSNEELRKQMGTRGRKFIEKNYSVDSNCSTFLSLFAR